MSEPRTIIRLMCETDGAAINQLFLRVFGIDRSIDQWRWKFLENPHGDSLVHVAECGGRIVGHYGMIPRSVWCRDRFRPAFQEVDVMVDPEHSRGGLFLKLGHACYREAVQRNAAFTFGFPNQTSMPVGSRLLRWRAIGSIPLFTLMIRPGDVLANRKKSEACSATVSPILNGLWSGYLRLRHGEGNPRPLAMDGQIGASELSGDEFCFRRDADYLRWRYRNIGPSEYIDTGHAGIPSRDHACVVAFNKDHEAYLMDFDPASDDRAVSAAIRASIRICVERRVRVLRAWALEGGRLAAVFGKLGFVRRDSRLHHVIHSFESPEFNRYLWDASRWYISAGDSDCI